MLDATVLIVDEELIRWSLRERLKGEGYEILEAGTWREALEQFKAGVDLVLLDYRLPDTDGLSVLRELKKLDPDILVILLTSLVSVETAVESMKLGAFHFANKPFNVDEVSAAVRPMGTAVPSLYTAPVLLLLFVRGGRHWEPLVVAAVCSVLMVARVYVSSADGSGAVGALNRPLEALVRFGSRPPLWRALG